MSILKLVKEFFGLGELQIGYTSGVALGPAYGKILKAKLSSGGRLGARYIEPYVLKPEHLSDREIEQAKDIIDKMDYKVGIHTADLPVTSADNFHYNRAQNSLEEYIKRTSRFNSQHILFHSSSQIRPRFRGMGAIEMRRAILVDHKGNLINEKILEQEETREWFKEEHGEWVAREKLIEARRELDRRMLREEEISREEREKIRDEAIEEGINEWDCRATEMMAYDIMAHYLYYTDDRLWREIAGGEDPEDVDEEFRDAAVSAKYLQGHLNKIKALSKKKGVKILIENAHDVRGSTEFVRLYRPDHIYWVIKTVNHPNVKLCLDFEHMVIHGLTPEEEIKNYPRDFGKQAEQVHISDPSPAHGHKALIRGNVYVYELLWGLRKKGFEEGKLLFEPGGEEEEKRCLESVDVVKEMARFLSMNIQPDDLPDEYYGITPQEMEHEKRVIESHTFDPLKGLIHSPELTDTLFGREMARRGRRELEKWAKEEWR